MGQVQVEKQSASSGCDLRRNRNRTWSRLQLLRLKESLISELWRRPPCTLTTWRGHLTENGAQVRRSANKPCRWVLGIGLQSSRHNGCQIAEHSSTNVMRVTWTISRYLGQMTEQTVCSQVTSGTSPDSTVIDEDHRDAGKIDAHLTDSLVLSGVWPVSAKWFFSGFSE